MLAVIILFLSGILVMFSSFYKSRDLSKYISMAGIFIAFMSVLLRYQFSLHFDQFYRYTDLALILSPLTLLIAFFIVWNYTDSRDQGDNASIYAMLLFSITGALLLYGYTNLVTLFLGIEILSIPLYVLAASNKDQKSSLEAGLKYFILGSFSSAFLLYGMALIYGSTLGHFQMDEIVAIQQQYQPNNFIHIGVLFVLVAIIFKMALAPFHHWSPDVYQGSPTMITAYMSTIVKTAATVSMYFLLSGFFAGQAAIWAPYLFICIVLSLIISSMMGLVQKNVKRLMAYSSISHAAFLLMSILICLTVKNLDSMVYYLVVYTLASLTVFIVLNMVSSNSEWHFDELNGLVKNYKIGAIAMTIAILSMAGIPATGGFVAKWNILAMTYTINKFIFILFLASSAIGIVYYIKLVNRILFYEQSHSGKPSQNWPANISLIILSISLIGLGLFPSLVGSFFEAIK